jgi:hypothetical protein
LLAAGTPAKAVSERLGHAKTSIAHDTSAHVLSDLQDRAVEAIDATLICMSACTRFLSRIVTLV